MTCPGCQAENRAGRRYCGRCGCNFAPACHACGFANEATDRFCGGCGDGLRAHDQVAFESVPASPASTDWPADELAGLFAPTPAAADDATQLPETGVDQDDLDRLFGAAP